MNTEHKAKQIAQIARQAKILGPKPDSGNYQVQCKDYGMNRHGEHGIVIEKVLLGKKPLFVFERDQYDMVLGKQVDALADAIHHFLQNQEWYV